MKHLIACAAAIILLVTLALPTAAASKPNPFANYIKKIAALEQQLKSLDSTKDADRIATIKGELDRARDRKDEALAKAIKPYELKIEKLTAQRDLLVEQRKPTANLDQQIKALNAKIEELDAFACESTLKEESPAEAETATTKGKNALKDQM